MHTTVRWFLSRPFRDAVELRKQVRIMLASQRDLLPARATAEVENGLTAFGRDLAAASDKKSIASAVARLEECAAKWLQPYPNASTRENIKEFLVSGVLILTIFCFFIQPMKIPSGSAQPTLYGNVITPLPERRSGGGDSALGDAGAALVQGDRLSSVDRQGQRHIPDRACGDDARFCQVPAVCRWATILTRSTGRLRTSIASAEPSQDGISRRESLSCVSKISSGDRLFVDRFTYNFRRPRRGETIVFTSTGIPGLIQHTHYIKRLIAMGGERVRIGDDRHVVVNGQRLDRHHRHFERVYAFSTPPRESVFSGHANDKVAMAALGRSIAPLFPDGTKEVIVRPDHYLAFGDNTLNSFDGRAWGDFPREKVVGKGLFVFWPFTERFGLIYW